MRFDRVVPGFLIAALLSPSAALAASITNRDDRAYTVTVIVGNSQKAHVLKPNAVLQGVCENGCLIRLGDTEDDPFELTGPEVTSIEEGQLYDDETEVPSGSGTDASVPGSGAQPSQPASQP